MSAHVNRAAAQLFDNPTLSDVTIKQICNGGTREYEAHKAVLCMESSYFLRAFTGSFQGVFDNVIELHDDDSDHFELLLKYIYTYKYDTDTISKLASNTRERVAIPIGIYAIADKYNVPSIYASITKDIKAAIIAHYVYVANADGPMGNPFASVILEGRRKFVDTPEYQQLVLSHPVFGADMALALARDTVNGFCHICDTGFIVRADILIKEAQEARVHCPSCRTMIRVRART